MASTRSSSPASEAGSTSLPLLSPTSKVKALLADFSDDSDGGNIRNVSGDARARLMRSLQKSPAKKNATAQEQMSIARGGRTASSDEEEEEVIVPRGRLAAAMQTLAHPASPQPQSTTPRRKRSAKRTTSADASPLAGSAASSAASEESDVSVVHRKRKSRSSRSPTLLSSPAQRQASPGLFVSPSKSTISAANASDSDSLPEDTADSRFKSLLERKRKEAQAREDATEALRVKRAEERKKLQSSLEADDMELSDGEGGRKLTQQAKPTRKASKKAIEEMHRESQRLSRNQQLTHYATTKKKYTKKDFLKRFNPQGEDVKMEVTPDQPNQHLIEPTSSSPARHSGNEVSDTPPTSPPSVAEDAPKFRSTTPIPANVMGEEDLPSLELVLSHEVTTMPKFDVKGKGKAVEVDVETVPERKPVFRRRQIRVKPAAFKQERRSVSADDSDSDLEIVDMKQGKLKVKLEALFDKAPIKKSAEDQSLYALQVLAHLKSPGKQNTKRNQKPSMTTSELQMSLQQKARQQAVREREEKLEDLRKRGIIVQSTEERQKEMAEVEDLIAKARQEAEDLAKKEKADAKRERKENGEVDPLGDSSDDEDWQENGEAAIEKEPVSVSDEEELSGSPSGSDEEDEDEIDLDEESGEVVGNPLLDNEASETEDDEAEEEVNLSLGDDFINDGDVDEEEEQEDEDVATVSLKRRARNTNVISDDEDELRQDMQTPSISRKIVSPQSNTTSPNPPTSVLRSATKTFIPGITANGPVGLGLTQIFAGTMDDSQMDMSQSQADQQPFETPVKNNNALAFLRGHYAPSLPPFVPTMSEEETQAFPDSQTQLDRVVASQAFDEGSQAIELNFTQSQINNYDNFIDNSQASPFPVTQDVGFIDRTPIRGRFVNDPVSTVDTLILDAVNEPDNIAESPVLKKKGKLRRRAPQVFSDDEDEAPPNVDVDVEEDLEINESVFDVMRKAAKKKVVVDDFDKKKSKAKEMVEEQANESEDEYAGLGGASDDESDEEADEYVKAMIDDENGHNIDKAKIAAFFA